MCQILTHAFTNDDIYFCFNFFFLIQSENSEIDHRDFGVWYLSASAIPA